MMLEQGMFKGPKKLKISHFEKLRIRGCKAAFFLSNESKKSEIKDQEVCFLLF